VGALLRSVPAIVNELFTDKRNEDIGIFIETLYNKESFKVVQKQISQI
jgi:hypothetical protein